MARKTTIGISCHPTMGGSGVVATELGIGLARAGYQVHFIAHSIPARLGRLEKNIYFHQVDTGSYPVFHHPPYALALAAKMCEVADQCNLDIIHAHYAIPHAIGAYLAKQMARPRSLWTVVTLHGTDITLVGSQPSFFRITKFSIEACDRATTVSHFLREQTEQVFGVTDRICVVPNFVNTEIFTPEGREEARRNLSPDGMPLVMHASNFRAVKNIPTVIRVFAKIRDRTKARLVLLGEGPEKPAALALAEEMGILCDVVLLGSITEIEGVLPAADLFLLPSKHEGFGLVALEAMSAGVPVIATDRGGDERVHPGRPDRFSPRPLGDRGHGRRGGPRSGGRGPQAADRRSGAEGCQGTVRRPDRSRRLRGDLRFSGGTDLTGARGLAPQAGSAGAPHRLRRRRPPGPGVLACGWIRMELIVDGYNVIHATPEWSERAKLSLADARSELERRLAGYRARRRGVDVLVYYDGEREGGTLGPRRARGLTVVFTRSSADGAIIGRVQASRSPSGITVVTNDRGLGRAVEDAGAGVIPVDRLLKWLSESPRPDPGEKPRPDTGVGKEITDDLKDVWGA